MSVLVVYGSQYASTKKYADKFGELTGSPVMDYKHIPSLDDVDTVVYFGALFAGSVKGIEHTVKKILARVRLIIVTVGLVNPDNAQSIADIRNSMERRVPKDRFVEKNLFHLRGALNPEKLTFVHKGMMKAMFAGIKHVPEADQVPMVKDFLAIQGKAVDFVDFDMLAPIVSAVADK